MPDFEIYEAAKRITESAFDFLYRSVSEIKSHPKYSVVHFATAVELILKARLMDEHWSLIVEKNSDADLDAFLAGKVRTVGPSEAIKRLRRVCGQTISVDAQSQIEKISNHRNRMIHFFHEVGTEEASPEMVEGIAKELCLCWFYLERLLSQWGEQFVDFDKEIAQTKFEMRRIRTYLTVAFERLEATIEKEKSAGKVFRECSGCGFPAAELHSYSDHLAEKSCLVCGLTEGHSEVECPEDCDGKIQGVAERDQNAECPKCGHELTSEELGEILETEIFEYGAYVTKNCAECWSPGTVVEHHEVFVCAECLFVTKKIGMCGWCSEYQIGGGDLEFSYHVGCEFCEGRGPDTS